jgi:hypothetical protein
VVDSQSKYFGTFTEDACCRPLQSNSKNFVKVHGAGRLQVDSGRLAATRHHSFSKAALSVAEIGTKATCIVSNGSEKESHLRERALFGLFGKVTNFADKLLQNITQPDSFWAWDWCEGTAQPAERTAAESGTAQPACEAPLFLTSSSFCLG